MSAECGEPKMAENTRVQSDPARPTAADKEERLRQLKERQQDDRHRKLEEIKMQALAAQRFKEQKDEERRKRLEELRGKEDNRRQQVEERKRAINEAEQERLNFILKRNQEREARIEARKRSEKSNSVFAFGSSTPRLLEPTDVITSAFWGGGQRRAASIQNIATVSNGGAATPTNALMTQSMSGTALPLTRRQSERDIETTTTKKRANSASVLDRTSETAAGCASGYVGRRRTDLMPTILPSKDSALSSRRPFSHSPDNSLNRMSSSQYSARPASLSSYHRYTPSMMSRSMGHLAVSKGGAVQQSGGPYHVDAAGKYGQQQSHIQHPLMRNPNKHSRLNKASSRSMHQLTLLMDVPPVIAPRPTRATQLRQQKCNLAAFCTEASSRPSSSLSQQSSASMSSTLSNVRHRPSSGMVRRPRPISIAITGITHDVNQKLSLSARTGSLGAAPASTISSTVDMPKPPPIPKVRKHKLKEKHIGQPNVQGSTDKDHTSNKVIKSPSPQNIDEDVMMMIGDDVQNHDAQNVTTESKHDTEIINGNNETVISEESKSTAPLLKNNEMATPDNSTERQQNEPARITTVEAAKAALAERRRLAREEAERQAEQERLRLEAEQKAELEMQRREEEQVQLLIEQQRAAEQERLEEAIREAKRREDEERARREEEARMKQKKEEAERKAREEAERQKAEMQERLRNEEREREERRKRVEAIMLRTRGKTQGSQQITDDKSKIPPNEHSVNGKLNESQENGTKNSEETLVIDDEGANLISPSKGQNTVNVDVMNSNNTNNSNQWQSTELSALVLNSSNDG